MNDGARPREYANSAPRFVPERRAPVQVGAEALRAWPGGGGRGLTSHIRLGIPRGVHAAGEARRALEGLQDHLDPGLFEDVRLLVTELVTNSVRHAEAPAGDVVELHVALSESCVWVEVADGGSGFDPTAARPGAPRASGWGLELVERMSHRWGIRAGRRTSVWFEMLRGPRLRRL